MYIVSPAEGFDHKPDHKPGIWVCLHQLSEASKSDLLVLVIALFRVWFGRRGKYPP
jgi:uncharacterized membrane protein